MFGPRQGRLSYGGAPLATSYVDPLYASPAYYGNSYGSSYIPTSSYYSSYPTSSYSSYPTSSYSSYYPTSSYSSYYPTTSYSSSYYPTSSYYSSYPTTSYIADPCYPTSRIARTSYIL